MRSAAGLGHGQDGLDGVTVGVGAVDGQGEPQGQASGPAGQVVGVVAGIPLVRGVVVEHIEIGGVLGVDSLGQAGLAVDEGGTVEGGEQPLVRVDHEGVRHLDAVEAVADGRGEERGAPVGPVDVEPEGPLPGDRAHSGQVVDDPGVGGAAGGHDGDGVAAPRVPVEGGRRPAPVSR